MPVPFNKRVIKDREFNKFKENQFDDGVDVRVCITDQANNALPWTKSEVVVPASSTVVIDTTLLSTFSRIDYIINFKDSPVTVTRSFKLVVQNDGGTVSHVISERMGGSIDADIDVTDDAVDAFVEVTNNESFAVTVTYLRAAI